MDRATLFWMIHGEIDLNKALRLIDHPEHQPDGFYQAAEILEANKDKFYFNPQSLIFPYFYLDDFFFYQFHSLLIGNLTAMGEYSTINHFKNMRRHACILYQREYFSALLFFLDKPIRLTMYQKLFNKIPDHEKFDLFIDVYSSVEYGFDRIDPAFIRSVFEYRFKSRTWIPFKDQFPHVGEWVTVYRGVTEKSSPLNRSYSWTLNKDVAEFFARRFNSLGKVIVAETRPEDIICYVNSRNEEEVIILPENVHLLEEIQL